MKDSILQLRSQGLSYRQIEKELGCSRSLVAYYCNPQVKRNWLDRMKANKESNPEVALRILLRSKYQFFLRGTKPSFTFDEFLSFIGSKNKCYLTGVTIDINDTSSWHLDHIIPVSRGGTCDIDNLAITSKAANTAKSDMLLDEFLQMCKMVIANVEPAKN